MKKEPKIFLMFMTSKVTQFCILTFIMFVNIYAFQVLNLNFVSASDSEKTGSELIGLHN